MAESNKGPWIIAVAIVVAAGVVVGALLYVRAEDQKQEERCRRWQAAIIDVADGAQLSRAEVARIDGGRPEGCEVP